MPCIKHDCSGKKFGVGYTTNLDDFQKMVEKDLEHSILENFVHPELTDDVFVYEKTQHENALALKASTEGDKA